MTKHVIERLKRLQQIDNRKREVSLMRDRLNEAIRKMHSILELAAQDLEGKRERLTEAERSMRELQDERQRLQDEIKRSQARLGSISKPKELNAAVREVENSKASAKEKDERISKLAEEIDKYRQNLAEEEEKLTSGRRELAEEESHRASELERLGTEIEERGAERAQVEAELDRGIVRKYERIAERREGLAVVPVRYDGHCTGCNHRVPPQLRNILLRGETLETCPSCSRYIYVAEEDIQAANGDAQEPMGV